MTDTRFGGSSAGLLQRLRRPGSACRSARRRGRPPPRAGHPPAAGRHGPRSGTGSVVVVEEDERQVRIGLDELADDMTRAGVAPTAAGISAALTSWVAHRPVPDAAAAAAGIAVLDWSDARRTAVGWRVVVRRGDLALPWTPSSAAGPAEVHRTRSAASGRAHDVSLDLRVEGPVALWSHPDVPVLATAALVDPERMLRRIRPWGCDGRHARGRDAAPAGGLRRPRDRRTAGGGDPRGQRHPAVAGARRPPLDLRNDPVPRSGPTPRRCSRTPSATARASRPRARPVRVHEPEPAGVRRHPASTARVPHVDAAAQVDRQGPAVVGRAGHRGQRGLRAKADTWLA